MVRDHNEVSVESIKNRGDHRGEAQIRGISSKSSGSSNLSVDDLNLFRIFISAPHRY